MNAGADTSSDKPSASDPTAPTWENLDRMDDFTQFQLKEYENISQAHFKTNEVLATFYRYYLLITAIPVTTVGLALMRLSEGGIEDEGRILAYWVFGVSAVLLSIIGVAVVAYIEGLRLDAILYARVVNSIRRFFFEKPGSEVFGPPVLPRRIDKPTYDGFGASFLIYLAGSLLNSVIFSAGVLAIWIDHAVPLTSISLTGCQKLVAVLCVLGLVALQLIIRQVLINQKAKKGF